MSSNADIPSFNTRSNADNSPALLITNITAVNRTAPEEEWEEWGSERMFCGIHYQVVFLSHQGGVKVLNCDNEAILKVGSRVRPSEQIAMRLVKEQTEIPVPRHSRRSTDRSLG
ncbi:hypothetical protein ACJ72_08804 [Emergomyces africanus]|uniref:Uncharacterized protein n=1 Tax=Emergomyces africanus TaxID=1955775 RepID=A0A1B7NJL0_9EURO|nr:hypothetical protein ACJ72_08804 [Emergomyces africanus]